MIYGFLLSASAVPIKKGVKVQFIFCHKKHHYQLTLTCWSHRPLVRSFLQAQCCNFSEDTLVLKKMLLENVFQSLFTF